MKYSFVIFIVSISLISSLNKQTQDSSQIKKEKGTKSNSSSLRKGDDSTSSVELPLKDVEPDPSDKKQKEIDNTIQQDDIDPPVVNEIAEINTLVELPITLSTNMNYYYPYFYKTHLIGFTDEVDTTILIRNCNDLACSFCDPINPSRCLKCATGFFLAGDSCVRYCPEGYVLDILREKCTLVASSTTEIVYTQAYSIGSCKNMCGKMIQDCSCSPSCKLSGNCCTDYDYVNCDGIRQKSLNSNFEQCQKNENCEYCDDTLNFENGVLKCNQCKDSFFLLDGRCYNLCPEGTVPDNVNFVCNKSPVCSNPNCDQCFNGSTNKCQTCKKGYFLYNNQCLDKCPTGYRADRITWACMEPPVFAWYWVYPSRGSCKDYCGIIVEDWDCSCSNDCFLWGNCCQDIEVHCTQLLFWRKSRTQDNKPRPKPRPKPISFPKKPKH